MGSVAVIRAAYDLVIISRYHDDGWRLRDVEALSEIEIGLDLGGKRAGGVDHGGHLLPVLLKPALGELAKVVLAGDRRLCVEYIAAKFVGQLRA